MAIIRNCAAGPRSKARKICEKGMSARGLRRRHLQTSTVIDRRYSLDPDLMVLTTLRYPEARRAIAVSNADARIF